MYEARSIIIMWQERGDPTRSTQWDKFKADYPIVSQMIYQTILNRIIAESAETALCTKLYERLPNE